MAKAAEVGHVVLTHHLPDAQPTFEANGYGGTISVGEDLATFIA